MRDLIRNNESYCDLDSGSRENVVRAVLNIMGKVCREFGNLDSGTLLVDVMNYFLGENLQ